MGHQPEPWHRWDGEDLILEIRVTPKAKRDAVGTPRAGRLRVTVTAPPAGGAANARVVDLLARAFAVPRSRVQVLRGVTGRDKRIRIQAPRQWPEALEE